MDQEDEYVNKTPKAGKQSSTSKAEKTKTNHIIAIERIFILQISLIVAVCLLWILEVVWPVLGEFWLAFLAGCIGASVAQLRRIRKGDFKLVEELAGSWLVTLMPALYGGVMAALAYLFFMAKILSGDQDDGLFRSNLFPMFSSADSSDSTIGWSFRSVQDIRPAGLMDFGKLVVWCFLAGYSERFVMGVLKQLEDRGEGKKS